MREKLHQKFKDSFSAITFVLIIVLALNIFLSSTAIAQTEELHIQITNEDEEIMTQIYEGAHFIVSVYYLDEYNTPKFLNGVEIEFNQGNYNIEMGSDTVFIQAPSVSEKTAYYITANKSGYTDGQAEITVLNQKKLIVSPEKRTVESGELFSVTITDKEENPISGATISVQSYGETKQTNDGGFGWLSAPPKDDKRDEITIVATKEGYEQGETTIAIYKTPPIPPWLTDNALYIGAAIVLIVTILYVNIRNKKKNRVKPKEFSNEQVLKKYNVHGAIVSPNKETQEKDENVSNEAKKGPKVEEIRISRPKKEKEIVSVYSERKEERKVMPVQSSRKKECDWFEGKDDIRFEIDKLTGKLDDEDDPDKWFEGIDDIREKIDERVKKKDKKKEEED